MFGVGRDVAPPGGLLWRLEAAGAVVLRCWLACLCHGRDAATGGADGLAPAGLPGDNALRRARPGETQARMPQSAGSWSRCEGVTRAAGAPSCRTIYRPWARGRAEPAAEGRPPLWADPEPWRRPGVCPRPQRKTCRGANDGRGTTEPAEATGAAGLPRWTAPNDKRRCVLALGRWAGADKFTDLCKDRFAEMQPSSAS